MLLLTGHILLSDWALALPTGHILLSDWALALPTGHILLSDWALALLTGHILLSDWALALPTGHIVVYSCLISCCTAGWMSMLTDRVADCCLIGHQSAAQHIVVLVSDWECA